MFHFFSLDMCCNYDCNCNCNSKCNYHCALHLHIALHVGFYGAASHRRWRRHHICRGSSRSPLGFPVEYVNGKGGAFVCWYCPATLYCWDFRGHGTYGMAMAWHGVSMASHPNIRSSAPGPLSLEDFRFPSKRDSLCRPRLGNLTGEALSRNLRELLDAADGVETLSTYRTINHGPLDTDCSRQKRDW